MKKASSKPSPRAMWLFRLYRRQYHHNLDRLLSEPQHWHWWNEMDNANRTYVLTGRWNG